MTDHAIFMRRALELAERCRGFTAPNPCVGAVLVRDGQVVAEGWHKIYGGPHAEREAIADARAKGVDTSTCDMYVTLEPCSHHGKTPPCTEAILEAGIRRVFVGCKDLNPTVPGRGTEYLLSKGVQVELGILEQECRDAIADFMLWKTQGRAWCTLKLAMTLDGRIGGPTGKPESVSGPESHRRVQLLRARSDAVLIGGGTLRADDPRLTCRLQPEGNAQVKRPLAIVATRKLTGISASFYLLRERPSELIFWTTDEAARSDTADRLGDMGCRVWGLPEHSAGGLDLAAGLERFMRDAGGHYVLCEGGGHMAMSLALQSAADELKVFLAPRALGDERAPASFAGRSVESVAEAVDWRVLRAEPSGSDLEITLRPQAAAVGE
ncbi:bifunctional diaminohydroxyphosphoribosylaminopyrimidine deaminase/5-amino-6-(5-phosphoribosylamino)uracil reductase RibD [Desulfocurvibacter africanus]|uniref:Riboflavin biosynthesis protein RibD n=1 Tax=Desulfocurvibacter africanus subsp. africanus str. Walvis Bay TaxID=690850 RepID=F3YXW6_DESAF|nr:bifunctional diaminohydroxyphosphoribosylaminopyrimidine deaminase/5-amino-6-(5-phosphoribosylamino)uracil reductase RibD [Desulfocurvibacter africanus]EGJ50668.1 riboflavin biosynthesis protein RibD [Desulfocurvibacter africanus subsp. africanus str. Walvis Bay]